MTSTILQRLGYRVMKVGSPDKAIRLAGELDGKTHKALR
jgi:hypothetical protein